MRKPGAGQIISLAGSILLCIGLLCNSFELISILTFRILIGIGILCQLAALVVICKTSTF